ncbi:hypothetical protein KC866_00225 [Patescibacteria group bacterium]|nr:hypothetical protein [Patescibacteria group bacterium]
MLKESIFNKFKLNLLEKRYSFEGDEGFQSGFWWTYELLTMEQKQELPDRSKLKPEKVFEAFQEHGENITEDIFFASLDPLPTT